MADNPGQQLRLKNLRSEMENVTRTRHISSYDTSIRATAMVPQGLSRVLREIRFEELSLLTRRLAASDATTRQLRILLIVVAVGSGTLLLWVLGLVVRDERRGARGGNDAPARERRARCASGGSHEAIA